MIAVAGDSIIAGDTSITGSIGVIFQYPQIKPLLDKLGVSLEEIKSSPMKAEPSPFHPPPEEAKTMIHAMVMDSYDWFVDIVAERRNLSRDKVLALANGTIFTGRQALKVGLVDKLGDMDDIRKILETKKVDGDLPVIDWQPADEATPFFLPGSFAQFIKLFGLGEYSAADEMKRLFGDKLFLDGLVSVWQFATK
jgi:protease-4